MCQYIFLLPPFLVKRAANLDSDKKALDEALQNSQAYVREIQGLESGARFEITKAKVLLFFTHINASRYVYLYRGFYIFTKNIPLLYIKLKWVDYKVNLP